MNKIGIYYAYWTHDWDADFHPFVDKVADIGFDLLEVNGGTIGKMTSEQRRSLKAHADDRNIALSYCVGLPKEYDLASEEKSVRDKGIAFLQQIAEGIGEMGGGNLGGIIYSYWPATLPAGVSDKRPYWDRSVASMKVAVKAAEANNVTFSMEVVNRFEQYLLNTCEEAVAYVKEVGSPNATVMLDTFHINIEEDSAEAIRAAGDTWPFPHRREQPDTCGLRYIRGRSRRRVARDRYKGVVMEPFLMPGGEVGRDIKVFRDLSVGLTWTWKPPGAPVHARLHEVERTRV